MRHSIVILSDDASPNVIRPNSDRATRSQPAISPLSALLERDTPLRKRYIAVCIHHSTQTKRGANAAKGWIDRLLVVLLPSEFVFFVFTSTDSGLFSPPIAKLPPST